MKDKNNLGLHKRSVNIPLFTVQPTAKYPLSLCNRVIRNRYQSEIECYEHVFFYLLLLSLAKEYRAVIARQLAYGQE